MKKNMPVFVLIVCLFLLLSSLICFSQGKLIKYISFNQEKNVIIVHWDIQENSNGYIVNIYKTKNSEPVYTATAKKDENSCEISFDKNCKFLELKVIKQNGGYDTELIDLEFDKENYGVKNNDQVILGIDELLTGLDVKLNPSYQFKEYSLTLKNIYGNVIETVNTDKFKKSPTTDSYVIELRGKLYNNEQVFDVFYGEKSSSNQRIILNKKTVGNSLVYRTTRGDIKYIDIYYYKDSIESKPISNIRVNLNEDNSFTIPINQNANIMQFDFLLPSGKIRTEYDGLTIEDIQLISSNTDNKDNNVDELETVTTEINQETEKQQEREIVEPFFFIVDYPPTKVITTLSEKIPMKINSQSRVDIVVNKQIVYQRVTSNNIDKISIPLLEGENEVIIRAYDNHGNYKIFSTLIMCVDQEELKRQKKRAGGLDLQLANDYESMIYNSDKVKIRGTVVNGDSLTANGNPVELDANGNFTFVFKMREGTNYLTLEAKGGNDETIRQKLTLKYVVNKNIINVNDIKAIDRPTRIIPEDYEPKKKEQEIENYVNEIPTERQIEETQKDYTSLIISIVAIFVCVGLTVYSYFLRKKEQK